VDEAGRPVYVTEDEAAADEGDAEAEAGEDDASESDES
jgi:hypothetical protein